MANRLIGYQEGSGFLYRLSGASKLLFFILVSAACMTTYDTRFLVLVSVSALVLFRLAKIKWHQVSFVLMLVMIFASLNLLMVYLFAPQYGDAIYGSSSVLIQGIGSYRLSLEEAFYLFNLSLKYICTVPLSLLFLMTTNPSQFASSLNQLGLPYKIAYAVSLTLRYIPDLQEDFYTIRRAQEARGIELSPKSSLFTRIKGNLQIVLPLIFSSLERIETISTAMELRRFGKNPRRSWYSQQRIHWRDYLVMALALSLFLLTLYLFTVNGGRFYNPWRT
ncbi:energy-coupling factor transporter transmembrane component T family protein [Streptococcus halichoeri]|uniref:energy-coupling factor transporter transmembrane component T family protein n=1 Tax=Streptococcus halichoeri TaxID=254785 RepID=UPI00135C8EF7|nr:energy-coupling factor transporter transmembrane component T [Streptococcus halichoeri]